MAQTFHLELATPERLLVNEDCRSAEIPAENGYIGVLPDHAPLFAQLGVGALGYVTESGRNFVVAVRGGFIEVRDNHVRLLADEARAAAEIDAGAAERDAQHAREQIVHPPADADFDALLLQYRRAEAWAAASRQAGKSQS